MLKESLLQLSNVVGYGSGLKRVGGKRTNREALLVFVSEKTDDIADSDRVPTEIDGMVTDVIRLGRAKPMLLPSCGTDVMAKSIAPLRGGLQIRGGTDNTIGTLGTIVKDKTTGKLLGMTNAHVAGNPIIATEEEQAALTADGVSFINGVSAVGLDIHQNYYNSDVAGTVFKNSITNTTVVQDVDVSFFTINSEVGVTSGIMGLTKYPQTFTHPDDVDYGTIAYKSGITTGVTSGEIISKNAVVTMWLSSTVSAELDNQIIIYSEDTSIPVTDHGDSGSALCIDKGDGKVSIVGLVHGGTGFYEDGSSYGIVCRIDSLVDTFDILPWDGTVITTDENSSSGVAFTSGLNTLYGQTDTTMLAVTNDYIDNYENPVAQECYHSLISKEAYSQSTDLILNETVLYSNATTNSNVVFSIELDSRCGLRLNSEIGLSAEVISSTVVNVAVSCNSTVNIYAETDSTTSLGDGVEASCDADIVIISELDSISFISEVANCNTDVLIIVDTESTVNAAIGSIASATILVNLFVSCTTNSTLFTDSTFVGNTVSACDAVSSSAFTYERAL